MVLEDGSLRVRGREAFLLRVSPPYDCTVYYSLDDCKEEDPYLSPSKVTTNVVKNFLRENKISLEDIKNINGFILHNLSRRNLSQALSRNDDYVLRTTSYNLNFQLCEYIHIKH